MASFNNMFSGQGTHKIASDAAEEIAKPVAQNLTNKASTATQKNKPVPIVPLNHPETLACNCRYDCSADYSSCDEEGDDDYNDDDGDGNCNCKECLLFLPISSESNKESRAEVIRKRLQKRLQMIESQKENVIVSPPKQTVEVVKVQKPVKVIADPVKNIAKPVKVIAEPVKVIAEPVKNIGKLVQVSETNMKKKKKLSPQQLVEAQVDEYLMELQSLNEELMEVNLNKKQTQNQLNQLRETNGKNKRQKMTAAHEKCKNFSKRQTQLEKEVEAIASSIKNLNSEIDIKEECSEMTAVMTILVPPPKEVEVKEAPPKQEEKVHTEVQQLYKMVDGKFVPVPAEVVVKPLEFKAPVVPQLQVASERQVAPQKQLPVQNTQYAPQVPPQKQLPVQNTQCAPQVPPQKPLPVQNTQYAPQVPPQKPFPVQNTQYAPQVPLQQPFPVQNIRAAHVPHPAYYMPQRYMMPTSVPHATSSSYMYPPVPPYAAPTPFTAGFTRPPPVPYGYNHHVHPVPQAKQSTAQKPQVVQDPPKATAATKKLPKLVKNEKGFYTICDSNATFKKFVPPKQMFEDVKADVPVKKPSSFFGDLLKEPSTDKNNNFASATKQSKI